MFAFFTNPGNDSSWRRQVTFSLHAELTGIKKLAISRSVQRAMNREVASLDRAKALLERS